MRKLKKILCLLIAGLLLAPVPNNCFALTVSEENELGVEFMEHVHEHLALIEDPVITGMIRQVGEKIVETLPPQPFKYHFYVVREPVYNAFAGPAAHVFINSGLVEAMGSEEELAGILAHEIAHVSCRHISERIEKNSKMQMASLVGLLAGIFIGGAGASAVGGALSIGSVAAGHAVALAYSREDEMQADKVGMQYLLAAGYGGRGLLESLKKIRGKTWFGPEQIPSYLLTHPATEERLVYLNTWLAANPKHVKPKKPIDPYPFAKMRARVAALFGDKQIVEERFARKVEQNPEDATAHYGYGLCLARINKREQAITHLQKALALRPFDTDILRDVGRVQFEAGLYEKALSILLSATRSAPEVASGFFWLGRTQMETQDLDNARKSFETALKIEPPDLNVFYYLGQVHGQMKTLDKAHYYLGMFHLGKSDKENARFHLQKALALAKNDSALTDKIKKALAKLSEKRKNKSIPKDQ